MNSTFYCISFPLSKALLLSNGKIIFCSIRKIIFKKKIMFPYLLFTKLWIIQQSNLKITLFFLKCMLRSQNFYASQVCFVVDPLDCHSTWLSVTCFWQNFSVRYNSFLGGKITEKKSQTYKMHRYTFWTCFPNFKKNVSLILYNGIVLVTKEKKR